MKRYSRQMKEATLSAIKNWLVKKCVNEIGICKDVKELLSRKGEIKKNVISKLSTMAASEEGVQLDSDSEKDVKALAKKFKCEENPAKVLFLVKASSSEIADKLKKTADSKGEECEVSSKDVYKFFMGESTSSKRRRFSEDSSKSLASGVASALGLLDDFSELLKNNPDLSRGDVTKMSEDTLDYSPAIEDAIDMTGLTPEMSDAIFNASNFTELELAIEDIAYKSGDFETPSGFFDPGEDGDIPAFVLEDIGTNTRLVIVGVPEEELRDLAEIWKLEEV